MVGVQAVDFNRLARASNQVCGLASNQVCGFTVATEYIFHQCHLQGGALEVIQIIFTIKFVAFKAFKQTRRFFVQQLQECRHKACVVGIGKEEAREALVLDKRFCRFQE